MTAAADPLGALLHRIEQARAAATPGPWRVPYPFTKLIDVPGREASIMSESDADAACIVAEHNAMPALLAAIRAVRDLADTIADEAIDSLRHRNELSDVAARIRAALAAAVAPTGDQP